MNNRFENLLWNWRQKTGQVLQTKPDKLYSRILFPIFGILSLTWFLVRVIPKPIRATYPCMRVAAPMASGFVVYILGLTASIFALKKARVYFQKSSYITAITLLFAGLIAGVTGLLNESQPVRANTFAAASDPLGINNPVGVAKGIFPGRVVWVHDPDATDETCRQIYGDAWFDKDNNDQAVIDNMLDKALLSLTGTNSTKDAWSAVFKFHNNTRGKGEVDYKKGEIVFIKINVTSAWSGNYDRNSLAASNNSWYGISETSPQLVLSVLQNLVNVVGVAQEDIYVGDPMKHIYKHCYDLWIEEFPNVHYLDSNLDNRAYSNREEVKTSTKAKIQYSDKGTALSVRTDYFYTIFDEMEYMLNIPTLKGHKHAGVTMFAKNHFGSHTRNDASHLHNGLVSPSGGDESERGEYGLYRVQVDLLGNQYTGKKNLVYLMDALWTSDYEIDQPDKWQLTPFNNDYTSSVFMSFDPVAIESVGYDFLKAEFTGKGGLADYPQMSATDDYLHQAADSKYWPSGISYAPDDDGTVLESLGVHEHWNNSTEKKYTRNLGTGEGIELVQVDPYGASDIGCPTEAASQVTDFKLFRNYPNPFNPATTIRYRLPEAAKVQLHIYNSLGQRIKTLVNQNVPAGTFSAVWNGTHDDGTMAPSGNYVYRLSAHTGIKLFERSQQMTFIK